MDEKTIARFWSKVEKTDGCWIWRACIGRQGYGRFGLGSRASGTASAHHVAWEITNGPRGGLWVLHKCDNKACVRPEHLFLGTHADNMRDMVAKGRSLSGERNAHARLTASDVAEIRALYVPRADVTALAEKFGISRRTVHSIATGLRWKNIE